VSGLSQLSKGGQLLVLWPTSKHALSTSRLLVPLPVSHLTLLALPKALGDHRLPSSLRRLDNRNPPPENLQIKPNAAEALQLVQLGLMTNTPYTDHISTKRQLFRWLDPIRKTRIPISDFNASLSESQRTKMLSQTRKVANVEGQRNRFNRGRGIQRFVNPPGYSHVLIPGRKRAYGDSAGHLLNTNSEHASPLDDARKRQRGNIGPTAQQFNPSPYTARREGPGPLPIESQNDSQLRAARHKGLGSLRTELQYEQQIRATRRNGLDPLPTEIRYEYPQSRAARRNDLNQMPRESD
jgi:hypothetical protein